MVHAGAAENLWFGWGGRGAGAGDGTVIVRLGARSRLLLEVAEGPDGFGLVSVRSATATAQGGDGSALPVLPDAATWVLPDLELLRAAQIEPGQLHPLVAAALVPDRAPGRPARRPDRAGQPHVVECRGDRHRIGLVDGVLAALDHDPVEIRREELLAELTGTPLPCLQAIDTAHREPECLDGIRERLRHGDTSGALDVVEGLLGPAALLRSGALRDALEAAAQQRIAYGLFRAGLDAGPPGPGSNGADRGRVRSRHGRRGRDSGRDRDGHRSARPRHAVIS